MNASKTSDKCQAVFPPHPRLPAINAPQKVSDSWGGYSGQYMNDSTIYKLNESRSTELFPCLTGSVTASMYFFGVVVARFLLSKWEFRPK